MIFTRQIQLKMIVGNVCEESVVVKSFCTERWQIVCNRCSG